MRLPTTLKGEDPNRESFPSGIFHARLQAIAGEFASALRYHHEYVGMTLLTALSAAIGSGFAVKVRNLHVEPAILWAVLVGKPGIGKTHVITHLFQPFQELDDLKYESFEKDMEAYEANDQKGQRPRYYQAVLRDFTFEALAESSKVNPHGIVVLSDEILSLTGNFNKFNKGNDEPYYLTLFSGLGISTTRKTQAPIHTKQSCVNIIGGIQPARLTDLLTKARLDNGFAARFLFAFPDAEAQPWIDAQFNLDIAADYRSIIIGIMNLAKDKQVIGFTDEAWNCLLHWQHENTAKANELNESNDPMAGLIKKWESYVCRFALIIQISQDYCSTGKAPEQIGVEAVEKAIRLFDYFLTQSQKVFGLISRPAALENLTEKQLNLYRSLPERFTTATAKECAGKTEPPISERRLFALLGNKLLFIRSAQGHYQKRVEL